MEDVEEEFRKHRQKHRGKRKKVFSSVRRQEKALKRVDVESRSMVAADDDTNSGERDIISTPPTPNVSSEIDFGTTSVRVIPENDGDDEDWVDFFDDDEGVVREETVSQKKIKKLFGANKNSEELLGYRLIDISILKKVFDSMPCPKCMKKGLLPQEASKRVLAFKVEGQGNLKILT